MRFGSEFEIDSNYIRDPTAAGESSPNEQEAEEVHTEMMSGEQLMKIEQLRRQFQNRERYSRHTLSMSKDRNLKQRSFMKHNWSFADL